jgi:general secretion pathway protein H
MVPRVAKRLMPISVLGNCNKPDTVLLQRCHAQANSRYRAQRCAGFTLLELVVVVLLLSIMLGLVVVNLSRDDSGELRDEAQRLALLLNTAQQDAILKGQVLALALEPGGYHFMRLTDAGTLQPITQDELLRARELPSDIKISAVEIAGTETTDTQKPKGIVLQPSGELDEFTITLQKGQLRWQVKGSLADGIRSAEPTVDHARS